MQKIPRILILMLSISLICSIFLTIQNNPPIIVQTREDRSDQLHLSADPNLLAWNTTWGGSDSDYGYGVTVDAAGNLYCVGSTWSFGAGIGDFAMVKLYPNGTRAWNTTWGGPGDDWGGEVAVDAAGNLYSVGSTESFGAGEADFAMVKLYPNGTCAWNTTWGGPGDDTGTGVAQDAAGNLYCIGDTESFGAGDYDFAIVKLYPNGTRAWNTTWGGSGEDLGMGVALDAAGNLYSVGSTESFGAEGEDFAMIKLYPNGTKAWNTTWGGSNAEEGYRVAVDAAGNLYCVGLTYSFGAGEADLAMVKLYPNGTRAWNTTWGGPGDDWGGGVAVDAAGNLYSVGSTESFGAGDVDFAVVRLFPNGTLAWNTTWGGLAEDKGSGMARNAAGNLYCVGFTASFGAGDSDFAVVKFRGLALTPPAIIVNTPNGNVYNSAPTMDVDFSSNRSLGAGYYKLDSYTPLGDKTTGWIQIFANQAENNYTTDFVLNFTIWNSLPEGFHVVYFKAWDCEGNINDESTPSWLFYKDIMPPTYASVTESADPLELGGTETIRIDGVADLSGIQRVLIALEGANHTMTNLCGGSWTYTTWIPSSTGNYTYTIYIQDTAGNWNGVNGSIKVEPAPPVPAFMLPLILLGTVITVGFFVWKRRIEL